MDRHTLRALLVLVAPVALSRSTGLPVEDLATALAIILRAYR